ncbi:hypothetical protein [Marinicrinis lubricantis]|uniref:Uncharacterized protein n=1 Tax=Marinicrinis lubricantis TaxID=2086470 RepID=A0ABW1ITG1_9BACL
MRKRYIFPILFYGLLIMIGTIHFFEVYLTYSLETVEPMYSGTVSIHYTSNFVIFLMFCLINLLLYIVWGLKEKRSRESQRPMK